MLPNLIVPNKYYIKTKESSYKVYRQLRNKNKEGEGGWRAGVREVGTRDCFVDCCVKD